MPGRISFIQGSLQSPERRGPGPPPQTSFESSGVHAYAPRSERLLGEALDILVAFSPLFLAVVLDSYTEASAGSFSFLALLTGLGYLLVGDGLPGGQSVAKRWLGMKVVSQSTGAPCTIGQSFIRNLFLVFFGPIDWIFIFGPKHQRLGDVVAGTIVIQAT